MQFAKEEIRERLLKAAREEFLKKGFRDASIRSIAAKAKTSKSNLYNYFDDKDALFTAVLEPTLTAIEKGFVAVMERNRTRSGDAYSFGMQKEYIVAVMEYVYAHREDVELLLFCAAGSSLAGYRDTVLDGFADVLSDWLKKKAPDKRISRFFIRCVADFYLSAIEGLLVKDVSPRDAAGYFGEFMAFVYGGWSAVLEKAGKDENNG
jgi:AcrR family transcriptional regulator